MKKLTLLFALTLLIFSRASFAQASLPDFGDFSEEERTMTSCPFDKEADAAILIDQAISSYDDEYHLITNHRVRIKVLNDRGIDRGNIKIYFYSKDKFEFITDVSGITFNSGAEATTTELDKRSVYTEKVNNTFSIIKFAMPNVKAGSIIEYKYQSTMKHYGGLRDWNFQSDLPTYRSCYKLDVDPRSEFTYQVQKSAAYPIQVIPGEGRVYFEMKYLPGIRFEPFMDAPKDYLQRVIFQLSGFQNVFGSTQSVNTTWQTLAIGLFRDDDFYGSFRKEYSGMDEMKLNLTLLKTATAKTAFIYNWVRDHFTWNGSDSKYAGSGLKTVWDTKTGTSGELNLLLVNLLQQANIEAYPLLVAERDYGKVDTLYPFIDRFNKTDAVAYADGVRYIMDVTLRNSPFDLTPYQILNTYAFQVHNKKYKLFRINSNNEKYADQIRLNAILGSDGLLTGTAHINSRQYSRAERINLIRTDRKKYIQDYLVAPYEGMQLDSLRIPESDRQEDSLVQEFNFRRETSPEGGFILLNWNLFTGLSRNLFKSETRFTNVNFGYPFDITLEATIQLPPGAVIDEIPKEKTIEKGTAEILVTRSFSVNGDQLLIRMHFVQTETLYQSNYYSGLRQFYVKMVEMLNEPLTIRVKK